MIIEVQTTRNETKDTAANPYSLTEEKPSRKPLILGGLLAAFALYLKSVFPGWGETGSEAGSQAEAETPKEEPKVAQVSADQGVPSQGDVSSSEESGESAVGLSGSGGRLVELQEPARFLSVETNEIVLVELASPAVEIKDERVAIAAPMLRPANDNPSPGRGSAGSGDVADDDLAEDIGDDDLPPDDDEPVVDDDDDDDTPDPDEDDDDDEDEDEDEDDVNRAPRVTGPVYLHDVFGCAAAIIGLGELLRNASDPDGDTLTITNLTISSGTIRQVAGGWSFVAALLGPVTITYEITDGALSVVQKAYFNVAQSLPILGTPGDDNIAGTECANDIDGGCGDDNIDGRGGNDMIVGGSGDDHIVAGSGDDIVQAGDGNDIVFGGVGKDWISGGKGDDRLFGGDGDDVIFGDQGDDRIDGEAGHDLVFGGAGNDVVTGGAGDDKLFGEEDADQLAGGTGDDILSGGEGSDVVLAEEGDDTVIGDTDQAADTYDGGDGTDLIDYSAATSSISVNLAEEQASGCEIGTDVIADFEAVVTGSGDDCVTGSDACEEITTGDGDDYIEDGAGRDVIEAGVGNDVVKAALDAVADSYRGGEGKDTLDYSASLAGVYIDLKEGTATGLEIGADQVSGFETVIGGAGNDTFVVVADAPVSLTGGAGEDVFEFEAASGRGAGAQIVHDILDFMVGDRIKVSKYEVFEEVMDTLEDRFEDIYGEKVDKDELPIRIRHEQTDNVRQTFIDVDFDDDDVHDMTINIAGNHVLLVVDNGHNNQT